MSKILHDPSRPIHILGAGLSGLTSAIELAHAGREVHVYEMRSDTGGRFHGDFQGIENWSSPRDHFDEMRSWGLDPETFPSTAFRQIDLVAPDGAIRTVYSPKIAVRMVARGTGRQTIDQGFRRQAEAAGVHLHYNTRRSRELCDIVATGPRQATGMVRGELFHTSHPNQVTLQLDDRLAPGAYTYLIIVDGVGLICTVLMRKQRDPDRFLEEAGAWYQARYPGLDRQPIRKIGGVGYFALAHRYRQGDRYYVGEAGGLQDCFWGFGMRYAITSGHLAARAILGELDYEREVRRRLRPFQEASLANRWWFQLCGRRVLLWVIQLWMRDQRRRGDGMRFLTRFYRPAWFHRGPFRHLARKMLVRLADDELGSSWMPFQPAKTRDDWRGAPC